MEFGETSSRVYSVFVFYLIRSPVFLVTRTTYRVVDDIPRGGTCDTTPYSPDRNLIRWYLISPICEASSFILKIYLTL